MPFGKRGQPQRVQGMDKSVFGGENILVRQRVACALGSSPSIQILPMSRKSLVHPIQGRLNVRDDRRRSSLVQTVLLLIIVRPLTLPRVACPVAGTGEILIQ